jgi:hypothetical protein
MRINLIPRKGTRRFAGVLAAAGALAVLGLAPAASARTVAGAGPAAVAAPRSSICHWLPTPSSIWITDPQNRIALIWGIYNRPGQTGVAYKVTGIFPYSTTFSFTAYNDLVDIVSPAYTLSDTQVIPDPGSVNPFIPGTRVEGKPRHYTAWFWPDSVPVPAGLKNVMLYPTKPYLPGSKSARWSLTMRMYKPQPGHPAFTQRPTITAVSAANPSKPVRCALTRRFTVAQQIHGFFDHKKVYGTLSGVPEPTTGNKVYFTAFPGVLGVGLDGYPANTCAAYVTAQVPLNKISVVTEHKVAPFFNNSLVTPRTIMRDWPIRYQSVSVGTFTLNPILFRSLTVTTDDALYTSDGSWVTILLPSEPRLTPEQIALVRAAARALNYNVIQLPPKNTGPLKSQVPDGWLVLRQKGISSSFPYSVLSVPCWSQHHSYKTWADQTSPAFFAKYASSPRNMGPYYINGVKLDFPQFMAKFSTK